MITVYDGATDMFYTLTVSDTSPEGSRIINTHLAPSMENLGVHAGHLLLAAGYAAMNNPNLNLPKGK